MATAAIQSIFPGTPKRTVTDITMDSSYLTGGEVFTAEALGLNNVEAAIANIKSITGTRNIAEACAIPQTDGGVKIKCADETPAEVTSTQSLNGVVIRVVAWGV